MERIATTILLYGVRICLAPSRFEFLVGIPISGWSECVFGVICGLIPDFPDEPLSMAQDLREPPWFSGFFALFLPS
jgi:hypothetical protein